MKRNKPLKNAGQLVVTRAQLENVVRQIEARFVQSLQLLEEHFDARLKALEPTPPPADEAEPVINAS
jgi:hypothetical protein